MSLNLTIPQTDDQLKPRITVIGIGGAGGNAVTNMINAGLEGVEFLVTNTDAQALAQSSCSRKIQLGRNLTRGLGAGARPDVGRAAAEEAMDEILASLDGCNMVFITAGMGGGTGTGAAPVIARAAREQGMLTVGVITKPFHFEGVHRMRLAEAGIAELTQHVDTLIIIPNQNLFRVANEKTTFADAFKMADDVLESGVRGVTDLMVLPGLINLDFNDIRTVMTEMGKAMMGTGEAEGDDRAIMAAEAAIANPLLDDVSMRGARGVLINITGGPDLTLFEVDAAANKIREQVDPEANIIFGSCLDEKLMGRMRVSIVATGIDAEANRVERVNSPSLSLIASERERRRPPAPSHPPAAAVSSGGAAMAVQESLRAQPVTLTATAQVLQPAEPRFEARPVPQPELVPMAVIEELTLVDEEELLEPEPPLPEPEPVVEEVRQAVAPPPAFVAPLPEPAIAPEQRRVAARDAESFARQVEEARDSFVAPAPMRVEERAPPMAPMAPRQPQPDPFREAELANATRRTEVEPPRARGPSLISKVTGLGRLLGGGQSAERRSEPAMAPAPVAPQRNTAARAAEALRQPASPPAPRAAAPQPARPPSSPPAAEPRTVQPRLNLDPVDRRSIQASDEHLLDIPAFLRRQAN
jgi:cell division protein FtsZ